MAQDIAGAQSCRYNRSLLVVVSDPIELMAEMARLANEKRGVMSSTSRWGSNSKVGLAIGLLLIVVYTKGMPKAEAQSTGTKSGDPGVSSSRVEGIVDQTMSRLEVSIDRHWHKGE